MIIIKSRYQKTRGSGMSNLFKNVVNKVTDPSLLQKVGNVAVNGALSSTQEAVKNKLKKTLTEKLKKKTKKQKIDEIIVSGIVL